MAGTQLLDTSASVTSQSRADYMSFLSGGAITAGDWVALDLTKTGSDRALYVITAAAVTDGNSRVIGVCPAGATAAGQRVRVCVAGYCEGARVTTAVGAGVPLTVDTTAGRADLVVAADTHVCGVSLEIAASNLADVFVFRRI
jgi:hypothetical protein